MSLRLIIMLLASPLLWADYSVTPVPSWVLEQPVPQAIQKVEGYGIRYRLVDRQRRLTNELQWESFHHYIEQPLNQDGLVDVGKLEINFRPTYQKMNLHYLQIRRDGRIIDKTASARIEEISVEPDSDSDLISQTKQLLIIIDDLKIGDQFEYAYSTQGRNPVFGDLLATSFQVGWAIPVDAVFTRLLAPKSYSLNMNSQNTSQTPVVSEFEGLKSYQWQQSPVMPVFPDDDMPDDLWIYPTIEYSQYDSWSEVADWASDLFHLENTPNHEQWASWVQELSKLPGKSEQAAAALKMVQDRIRYVGIEVGMNSHMPHSPDETLSLGYGDCKDKSLLLVSLLDALNIEAEPALVHSDMGQSLLDMNPSPKAFDHVITKIKLDGQIFWVDPTRNYQAGNYLTDLGYVGYGVALSAVKGADIETMPWTLEERPKVEVTETFRTFGYQVPVHLKVVSTYSGSEAEFKRRQLLNNGLRELGNDYLNYYDRAFGGAQVIKPLYYVDDPINNRLNIIENYWLDEFWQWSEDQNRYEYSIEASVFGSYLDKPKQLIRQYPWGQKPPKHIVHHIDIYYPEFLSSAQYKPLEYVFEDDYMRFLVSNQELGHVTRYQFDYLNHKDRVNAEDIRSHARLLDEASESMSFSGWVGNDNDRQNKALYPWFQRIESQIEQEQNE